jgi:hypothetical protein
LKLVAGRFVVEPQRASNNGWLQLPGEVPLISVVAVVPLVGVAVAVTVGVDLLGGGGGVRGFVEVGSAEHMKSSEKKPFAAGLAPCTRTKTVLCVLRAPRESVLCRPQESSATLVHAVLQPVVTPIRVSNEELRHVERLAVMPAGMVRLNLKGRTAG